MTQRIKRIPRSLPAYGGRQEPGKENRVQDNTEKNVKTTDKFDSLVREAMKELGIKY